MAGFTGYNGTTGTELVSASVTPSAGFTISNVNYTGVSQQAGFYDGSFNSYGISNGIVLTTGLTSNLNQEPINDVSKNNNTAGDSDVTAAANAYTPGSTSFDANILSFDITVTDSSIKGINFQALFASEEYPNFINKQYTDTAIVSVNGSNVAITNGDQKQPIRCLIPGFDGAHFTPEWRDALWARFFTGAPPRRRQSVARSSIVKRA